MTSQPMIGWIPGVVAGFGKLHGPAEIVVIGDGQGLIAKAGGLPHQLSYG